MPTDSRISATEMIENICKSNVIETQVSAMSLLGWAHFLEEGGGGGMGYHYLWCEGREVWLGILRPRMLGTHKVIQEYLNNLNNVNGMKH